MERKEINTERPNLFEPNVYITFCVEIQDEACLQKLMKAVQCAYEANEVTMSKIVLDHGKVYYEKMTATGCRVEFSDANWMDLVKENEQKPFELERGELVRTFLIPGEDSTQLLVMAHHLAGDGKSVLYLVQDIMRSFAGEALTDKPLTLLVRDSLPKKGLSLSAKWYAAYCRKKWTDLYLTWQDYYAIHAKYWSRTRSEIQCKTLSVDETNQIIEAAKKCGCTVNSWLITRCLQKYGDKCEVGIPVSVRKPGNESMSNFTSGISIGYQYNRRKSFEENAMQVHKKISDMLRKHRIFVLQFLAELPMTLIDAVLLNTHGLYSNPLAEKTAEVMGYTGKKKRGIGVTNLGVLDISTAYGDYKISNVIFVPPAVSYSDNIIGVSTVNGRMSITYHGKNEEMRT